MSAVVSAHFPTPVPHPSLDHRLRPESVATAMATAFFCPSSIYDQPLAACDDGFRMP